MVMVRRAPAKAVVGPEIVMLRRVRVAGETERMRAASEQLEKLGARPCWSRDRRR